MNDPLTWGSKLRIALCCALLGLQVGCKLPGLPRPPGLPGLPRGEIQAPAIIPEQTAAGE